MKRSELKKLIREVVMELQNQEVPADLEQDFQDWQDKEGVKDIELNKLERGVNEALSAKGPAIIQGWVDAVGARQAGIKIIDSIIRKMVGLSTADLPDSATFANGLDSIEEALKEKDYQGAYNIAKETAQEMLSEEGFEG
jgi:hypothetical protein